MGAGLHNSDLENGRFWHHYWQNRIENGLTVLSINKFIHQTPLFIMLILGIALSLFVVGGGLISLTNALSRRGGGSQH